jgi:hypothetical protein
MTENSLTHKNNTIILADVYRLCMVFIGDSQSFLRETENLRRLGINSQIIAAHAGKGGRAVEVIVAEIGRMSSVIRGVLETMLTGSQDVSKIAVQLFGLGFRSHSYDLGSQKGIAESSKDSYLKYQTVLQARLVESLDDLKQLLHKQEMDLKDLDRSAVQIPMTCSLMKIVVTEVGHKKQELSHAAKALEAFHGFLVQRIEVLQNLILKIQFLLKKIDERGPL